MPIDREMLKGATETLVLTLLCEGPDHGYALARRLRERSEDVFRLGEGTLYPLLYKLESRGWIRGAWQAGTGRRKRRVYCITPEGKRRLADRTAQWQELARGMGLVLGGPGARSPATG